MTDTPMPEEGFLRRWARLKAQPEPAPAAAPRSLDERAQPGLQSRLQPGSLPITPPAAAPERPAPTLDDVARLTPQSDYSAFVAGGVDPAVRRLALKKLFADPNFAVMDGLDIYIDDYTRASPLTDAMLASLKHAPGVLERLFDGSDDPAPEPSVASGGEPAMPAAPEDVAEQPLAGVSATLPAPAPAPAPAPSPAPLQHSDACKQAAPSPQGHA